MGTRISFKKSLIVLGLAAIFTLSGVLTAGAGEPLTMEQVKAKVGKAQREFFGHHFLGGLISGCPAQGIL